MTLPVTLQQIKDDQRIDTDAEDADLTLKLASAQALVLNYLKVPSIDALAVGSPASLPDNVVDAVSAATRLLVGYLYKNRDGDPDKEWQPGYLPAPVTAMLYPLRDPACA